jgi:hypothetical protein
MAPRLVGEIFTARADATVPLYLDEIAATGSFGQ